MMKHTITCTVNGTPAVILNALPEALAPGGMTLTAVPIPPERIHRAIYGSLTQEGKHGC